MFSYISETAQAMPIKLWLVCHTIFCNQRKSCDWVCRIIACADRMRSSQPYEWKARLTRFDQSEKRWNERSQDGGPIARGNRMYSSCLFSISACGKHAWQVWPIRAAASGKHARHGLTNQSSSVWKARPTRLDQSEQRWRGGTKEVKMASESCDLPPQRPQSVWQWLLYQSYPLI